MPSAATASLSDAGSCPAGFSCNTSNYVYYGKYVFATPTGTSTPFSEGQTSSAVGAGNAINFSHPANYPPDASGWLPAISTTSENEILQPVDGLQIYCGDGTPGQYVWNLPYGAMCALGSDAHIASIQTMPPEPLRFGASDVLVTVGGQTALQNQAANGQYDAGIDGGSLECGPVLNSAKPYSVGVLNLLSEEQSGPFFTTVNDCGGVGIYEATPGAQNGSFYADHIAGGNFDYSIGVAVEDVAAFREVNNLSVGASQGTQWFDVAGVYFFSNPLTNLGQTTTAIRNIESEAVMDVVKVDNAQAHIDHLEMTSTSNRVDVNLVHLGYNRQNPVAEGIRAKSTACAIQDDAVGPLCTSGSNKTPGLYSPQQTTQAINGSNYNTQVIGLTDVSGGVDFLNVTNAASGNPATVTAGAGGTDANINLSLSAQGTGKVQAPTPSTADSSTAVATTAYVQNQGYALLASPTFSGTPTAPTPSSGDSSTKIATTAFVANQYLATWEPTGTNFSVTGVAFNTSTNHANLFGITLREPVTTTQLTFYVATADNSSDTYDIGIYQGVANSTNNLIVHTGALAGSSIATASGYVTLSWTSSATLPPGRYYLLLYANEASAPMTIGENSGDLSFAHNSSYSIVPASGALPSSFTSPADSFTTSPEPYLLLH